MGGIFVISSMFIVMVNCKEFFHCQLDGEQFIWPGDSL